MNEPASNPTDSAALDAAIEKAKEVAADIKQAADDLAVANTVLETKLAEEVKVGEVAQALDHTESVEKTLTKSAEALEEVNTALENASGGERT
jgi:transcription elongation GreA/GreB family factor